MFKILLFICAVSAVNCEIVRTAITLPPEIAFDIAKAIKEVCVPEDRVPDIIRMIREGETNNNTEFKKIIHCVIKEAKYMTADGKRINVEKAASIFPNKVLMFKILSQCDKNIVTNDPEEYCIKFYDCFQENTPYRLSF
uniref:Odorant-binding protein 20 n=1 Tax=Ectropis obliqua TaxID=248899 RepID=A0A1L2BLG4_ECTOB|nr:odorant-binding protein 20 [Ectropis obliqua]